MIHEGFTWYVLAALEAIGIVGPGEGGPFVEAGNIALGARLPVNTARRLALRGPRLGHQPRHRSGTPAPARGPAGASGLAAARHVGVVIEGNFFEGSVLVLRR